MASRQVIEHTCDRCSRVWIQEVHKPSVSDEPVPITEDGSGSFSMRFCPVGSNKLLEYDFGTLCSSCSKAIKGYVRQLAKLPKEEESSSPAELDS